MADSKIKVAVICGGISNEHEISLISAYNIQKGLDRNCFEVYMIGISKNGMWYFGDSDDFFINIQDIKKVSFKKEIPIINPFKISKKSHKIKDKTYIDIDVYFPITHGIKGEDGVLQGLLELSGKPYVGSNVLASAICMDKDICKRLLIQEGIKVTPYTTLYYGESISYEKTKNKLGKKLVVKPSNSGSSLGVSIVESKTEFQEAIQKAFKISKKILIEKKIYGREIECSVLGNLKPKVARVLGEIVPNNRFYSYESKYIDEGTAQLIIPAKIELSIAFSNSL